MKRVLFYAEGPNNTTGFSLVNRRLAEAIAPVCELVYVASSHWGHPDDSTRPYKIIGCPQGMEKPQQRNLENIMAQLDARAWDIFFYQGDIGANDDVLLRAIQIAQEDPTKSTIYYVPCDIDDAMPEIFQIARAVTVPVCYTQQGVDVATRLVPELAGKFSAIGLGTEPDVFFPLSPEERKAQRKRIFTIEDDTFIVVNVNRNQMRKDLVRTMACFHDFHKLYPHSMLYLHSVIQDYGGNLMTQAKMVGMDLHAHPSEVAFSSLDLSNPWSREDLNNLYNAADCLVSTAYGEGWGLATTEAMCAGTPVMVPYNTANIDILGKDEERGWGMRTGGDLDHTAYLYEGGGAPHDVVWADSFLLNLGQIYEGTIHPDSIAGILVKQRKEAARAWCLDHTWEHRARAWREVIEILSGEREAVRA